MFETRGGKERYKLIYGWKDREIDSEISGIEIVRSLRCCWLGWWQVLVKLRSPCRYLATILDSFSVFVA